MSGRDELLRLDEELQSRKLEMLRMEYITSKHKLVKTIQRETNTIRSQISRLSEDDLEYRSYLEAKVENLENFCETVLSATLFDQLDNWWVYEFSIGCMGTALYIRHIESADIEGEEDNQWLTIYEYDATYRLLQNECRLMSADEFAIARNAAAATVRVWIRRGKIRSAVKMGTLWKIPELTPPFKRGYTKASYSWDSYLDGIPKDYESIIEPGNLIIRQDEDRKGFTVLVFNTNDIQRKTLHLSNANAEKFETMLIANPAIKYTGEIKYIRQ